MTPEEMAPLLHSALSWYEGFRGPESMRITWGEMSEEQRSLHVDLINEQLAIMEDSGFSAEEMHNAWVELAYQEGWRHGDKADAGEQVSPMLVPFMWLSPDIRAVECMRYTMIEEMFDQDSLSGPMVGKMAYNAAFWEMEVSTAFLESIPLTWKHLGNATKGFFLDCGADCFAGNLVRPQSVHASYCEAMMADGWSWGPIRNHDEFREPLLLPMEDLPFEETLKFYVISSVLNSFAGDSLTRCQ